RPEVVRREGELPAIARGVIHEGNQERLRQRWAKKQELRRHRVKDVRSADTTVRMVLLAEVQRLAVGVRDEFARGETLAVGQHGELRVFLAAGPGEVGDQLGVE